LGKIYKAIPWDQKIPAINLKEYKKGPGCLFSCRGKLALMFLKHYCGCSDKKLIEQLNGSIYYQIFCDILLALGQHIENFKLVSQIRCEIASLLDVEKLEEVLMDSWRPYMSNQDSITCDATCYESSIKYPSNIKLLFDSVNWIYSR